VRARGDWLAHEGVAVILSGRSELQSLVRTMGGGAGEAAAPAQAAAGGGTIDRVHVDSSRRRSPKQEAGGGGGRQADSFRRYAKPKPYECAQLRLDDCLTNLRARFGCQGERGAAGAAAEAVLRPQQAQEQEMTAPPT